MKELKLDYFETLFDQATEAMPNQSARAIRKHRAAQAGLVLCLLGSDVKSKQTRATMKANSVLTLRHNWVRLFETVAAYRDARRLSQLAVLR